MTDLIVPEKTPAIPSNLGLALKLIELGWRIFPCKPDKKPYWHEVDLPNGKDNATLDIAQVRAWWNRWPEALIGIYCEKSGFFAIDIDNKDGRNGNQAWTELVETYGGSQPIMAGPVQITPSGGYHILFKLPQGVKVTNNANKLGPGLDLRSNGYICTGGKYAWLESFPYTLPIPECPAWLADRFKAMSKKLQPAAGVQDAPSLTNGVDPGKYWLNYYLKRAAPGNRNESGFGLACQLRDSGLSMIEAESIMGEYARNVPGDGYSEREALASLKEAYTGSRREAARLPGLTYSHRLQGNGHMGDTPMPEDPPAEQAGGSYPGSSWNDIAGVIGPITWANDKWLANGMLHIIASEPGKGKSALCLRVAGCFINGLPFPDGSPFKGETGTVLWCEAEAGQAINLERARKWGLPLDKLRTPLNDPLEDLKLDKPSHQAALEYWAMQDEVKLVILDSLRGLHTRDENSSEVMEVVHWLATLARDTGKPFILTHHLRKKGILDVGEGPSLDRLRGSTAITQSARLVWALDTPDPMMDNIARLSVIKSNLAKFPNPIGMTINETGVHFTNAPESPRPESVADKAADLLMVLLSNSPMPATDIEAEINGAGISIGSAKRAKARLGIVSVKKADGRWYWSLPAREDKLL